MSDSTKAVFLSYASQDAEAARRICAALRAAGVEVWFDQSELVGGDAWDQKIRRQIKECALFAPVISAATQARTEGYFRLEWRLADQRTHLMAKGRPFLLPVVIDATRDAEAHVPDSFTEVQWTRLRPAYGGQAQIGGADSLAAFCERVQTLLGGSEMEAGRPRPALRGSDFAKPSSDTEGTPPPRESRRPWLVPAIVGAVALTALVVWRRWTGPTTHSSPIDGASSIAEKSAAPITEARKLALQARALIDDDPLAVRQNFVLAEELCKKAVALDVSDGEAWATYARVSLGFWDWSYDDSPRRHEAARSQSQRAIRLAPDSIEAGLAEAGLAYLSRPAKDGDEPEPRLRALLRRAPADRRIYRLLANTLSRVGRSAEASALRLKSAALPGGDPQALFDDASPFFTSAIGNPWLADRRLDRVFAATPTKTAYHARLVTRIHTMGDLEAAQTFLATIPEQLMTEDLFAAQAFILWRRLGEPEKALAAIKRIPREFLEERRQKYPRATLEGLAHALAGRDAAAKVKWTEALRLVEQRLPTESNQPVWIFNKALLLALLGQKEAAKEQLDAFRQLGGFAEFLGGDGGTPVVLLLLGETDAAIVEFQRQMAQSEKSRLLVLTALRFDPLLKPLRDNPRGQAMIKEGLSWLEEMRLVAAVPATPPSPAAQPPTDFATAKSVAVLAFRNVGGDPANEAFVEGIGEELIAVLGRVPGLTVKGSSSLSFFIGKEATARDKGQKLGVTYLVDGSVRRSGGTVRITAQLTRATNDETVWTSEPLSRDTKDVFAVQEEIAGLIAKALSLKLGASSAASKAPVNPEAFELYVQARQAWNLRTSAGFDRAETALTRALALEPNFARAHAALADVWVQRFIRTQNASEAEDQSRTDERARILAKAHQAITLDPDSAEAHASLGLAFRTDRRPAEAELALRRAVALNPNYASAQQWLGGELLTGAHMQAALVHLKLATELDPLVSVIWDNYGGGLRFAGRLGEAIVAYDRALALQPGSSQALTGKAHALIQLGRNTEAVALVRQLPDDNSRNRTTRFELLVLAGLKAEAEALLAGPRSSASVSVPGGARGLLVLGRTEEALARMNPKANDNANAREQLWNPIYDPVRKDPRWVKLMAEAGLTEAHARAQAWRQAHPAEKPDGKK